MGRVDVVMKSAESRFWQYVEKTDGCWLWKGAVSPKGYGVFSVGGKNVRAHRYSYTVNVGPIPDGHSVLHRCDTPGCVRPTHLRHGTNRENMEDRNSKGRAAGGKKTCSLPTLTESQVREIKERLARGEAQRSIARDFPVDASQISRISTGQTWAWVAL